MSRESQSECSTGEQNSGYGYVLVLPDVAVVFLFGWASIHMAYFLDRDPPRFFPAFAAISTPLVYLFFRYVVKIGSQKPWRFLIEMVISYLFCPIAVGLVYGIWHVLGIG